MEDVIEFGKWIESAVEPAALLSPTTPRLSPDQDPATEFATFLAALGTWPAEPAKLESEEGSQSGTRPRNKVPGYSIAPAPRVHDEESSPAIIVPSSASQAPLMPVAFPAASQTGLVEHRVMTPAAGGIGDLPFETAAGAEMVKIPAQAGLLVEAEPEEELAGIEERSDVDAALELEMAAVIGETSSSKPELETIDVEQEMEKSEQTPKPHSEAAPGPTLAMPTPPVAQLRQSFDAEPTLASEPPATVTSGGATEAATGQAQAGRGEETPQAPSTHQVFSPDAGATAFGLVLPQRGNSIQPNGGPAELRPAADDLARPPLEPPKIAAVLMEADSEGEGESGTETRPEWLAESPNGFERPQQRLESTGLTIPAPPAMALDPHEPGQASLPGIWSQLDAGEVSQQAIDPHPAPPALTELNLRASELLGSEGLPVSVHIEDTPTGVEVRVTASDSGIRESLVGGLDQLSARIELQGLGVVYTSGAGPGSEESPGGRRQVHIPEERRSRGRRGSGPSFESVAESTDGPGITGRWQ